jgi:hypothetical protein
VPRARALRATRTQIVEDDELVHGISGPLICSLAVLFSSFRQSPDPNDGGQ